MVLTLARSTVSQYLTVREQQEREVQLSKEDCDLLRNTYGKYVDVISTDRPETFTIKAKQYVGFIGLSPHRTLEIRPKVRIDVLFAMLNNVHRLPEFSINPQVYTSVNEVFEFIVNWFVSTIEDLIMEGVLHDFVSTEDELRAIRGKILLTETIRSRPIVRDRHWCRFVNFTTDVIENQILKRTAEMLTAFRYWRIPDLSSRLQRVLRIFSGVSFASNPQSLFEHLVYHRLNERYQPALSLAKMLLEYLSPSGKIGEYAFRAFLVDMDKLFEKYVAVALRESPLIQNGFSIVEQNKRRLDIAGYLSVQPDVVIYYATTPRYVIDMKYKLGQPSSDVYQVLSYCHALDLNRGLLVYPASEFERVARYKIKPDGRYEITAMPLDLSGNLDDFRRQTDAFLQAVWREVQR